MSSYTIENVIDMVDQEDYQAEHVPVMLGEVINFLDPQIGGVYVDCTLGLGGHAQEILKRIGPTGKFIGIDRDASSLAMAAQNLSSYSSQCHFVHDDYRNLDHILKRLNITQVDGILLDLGISSFQLNNPERGFSLKQEGPLDMRMDQDSYISAYDLVNTLSEREIATLLKNFGQERWYNRIAHQLVVERSRKPITSTKDLSDCVMRAIPKNRAWQKIHPATRTFQALRIAVNRELESVELILDKCLEFVKVRGRIVVISFHSLEDRIAKVKFREFEQSGKVEILTKKPLDPTEEEVQSNPRSRSAHLRAAERIV